jgi:hypothetical protein
LYLLTIFDESVVDAVLMSGSRLSLLNSIVSAIFSRFSTYATGRWEDGSGRREEGGRRWGRGQGCGEGVRVRCGEYMMVVHNGGFIGAKSRRESRP